MSLDLRDPPECLGGLVARWRAHRARSSPPRGAAPVSLLPGPAEIPGEVRAAWGEPPVSHRSGRLVELFERVRDRLEGLVGGASRAALFCGSGTLANDVVAATLAAEGPAGPGLILANGEFGARLVRQARRSGLGFRVIRQRWGRPWDLSAVAGALGSGAGFGWIWCVHLESSTGVLNDLGGLKAIAGRARARLCVDCVSSLGAVPLDLGGVHLASGSSGKALGSYAGLGVVFARDAAGLPMGGRVPGYLDLRAAMSARGPRFTFPSPLVAALDRALEPYDTAAGRAARYAGYEALGRRVRSGLRSLGLEPVAGEGCASPVMTSFGVRQSLEQKVGLSRVWLGLTTCLLRIM